MKKTKSHMLQIRMSPAELREVKQAAKHLGLGLSELVRMAVGKTVQRARRAKAVTK